VTKAWNLLTIGGLLLIVVSFFADQIGVGRNPGFGWGQGAGVVLGLVLILVSPYMKRRRARLPDSTDTATPQS
jgi:drug/metabolite transporter (DMT)-like permease